MATSIETSKQDLLRDLLKQVSRLFYTTLVVVPADVRDQVSFAYLFARAADTIADTELIDRPRRLDLLGQFKAQFVSDQISWSQIRDIQQAMGPLQQNSSERILLERLEDCFRLFQEFSPDDRRRMQRLMTTLTQGMEMDLVVFPGQSAEDLVALKTLDDLDRYTYYVAGCVGEFWTDLMCAHRTAFASWKVRQMSEVGVRFGKGLQLTNIVKDVAHDLQKGRCYVPAPMLAEAGLTPRDLLNQTNPPRFRPVLSKLVRMAAGASRPGLDVHHGDSAVRNTPPALLHVADSVSRRIAQAGAAFAGSVEPRRESEDPPQQGLPDPGADHLHRRLRLCRDGLLGQVAEADCVSCNDATRRTERRPKI